MSKTRASTVIDGFKISIDNNNCWIEQGNYCSSLPAVEGTGEICDNATDTSKSMPESTVDKIRSWADANGF